MTTLRAAVSFSAPVADFLLILPILLLSVVAHEYAHAWTAYRQGDTTAYMLGRLTFNPLRHIDPFGTIALPALLLFLHLPVFGYAKPVPVNFRSLYPRRLGMVAVAAAGPLTNFVLAAASAVTLRLIDASLPPTGMVAYFLPHLLAASVTVNVMLGDKVRKWSRVRVHHHFFPHYIDQPQVFVGPKSIGKHGRDWQTEAIDYVILSALSSSPNQLYYLPTKAGMPEVDKQTIHKWMDWGRKNESYLLVRKDLPDWPQAGKTDGSAHIIKDRGYVFLFNPNAKPLEGSFGLDDSIGLTEGKGFRVSSVYPSQETRSGLRRGDTVRWPVPPRGAMILEVMPEQ